MRSRARKVTVNVPADVLENAVRITGKGVTPTVIEGREEFQRREKRSALRALCGKRRFDLDLDETRRGHPFAGTVDRLSSFAGAAGSLMPRAIRSHS